MLDFGQIVMLMEGLQAYITTIYLVVLQAKATPDRYVRQAIISNGRNITGIGKFHVLTVEVGLEINT
jgi:hypothetical protein